MQSTLIRTLLYSSTAIDRFSKKKIRDLDHNLSMVQFVFYNSLFNSVFFMATGDSNQTSQSAKLQNYKNINNFNNDIANKKQHLIRFLMT